jgi:hypothetical protein
MMLATSHNLGLLERTSHVKPYRLTYELRPGYLYVNLSAETLSYQIARQYWNEIVVMLTVYPSKRVLVDKDISAEMPMVDAYRMATEVAHEFRNVRLALYDRHAHQKTMEFDDLVATNRGLNTKSFSDMDSAEQWLLAGASQ